MADPQPQVRSRLAIGFVSVGALLGVFLLAQLVWTPSPQPEELTAASQPATPDLITESRRTIYLLAASLATLLVLTLFFVGLYLLLRFGRELKRPSVGGRRTPYVDIWRSYRLSEDEIARATHEQPGDAPGEDDPPPGVSE